MFSYHIEKTIKKEIQMKKLFKRILIVMFALVALFAAINPAVVNANSVRVTKITLSDTTNLLTGSRQITATLTPDAPGQEIIWTSSNPRNVRLSATKGSKITITAVGNGESIVTATLASNRNVKAVMPIRGDIGQPISSLPVGARIKDGDAIYRIVDKGQPYGVGLTAASGFNARSNNYVTLIMEQGINDMFFSTKEAKTYEESSVARILTSHGHLSSAIKSKLVRVRYESGFMHSKKLVNGTVFLPSLNELGYKYGGFKSPFTEGRVFQAYSSSHYHKQSTWTRTRVRAFNEGQENNKAFEFVSMNVAVKSLNHTRSRVQPVLNITPDLMVSSLNSADGTYRIR